MQSVMVMFGRGVECRGHVCPGHTARGRMIAPTPYITLLFFQIFLLSTSSHILAYASRPFPFCSQCTI